MKNIRTHITRLLIVVVALICGYFTLTTGRTAGADSTKNSAQPTLDLRGPAAIRHLEQTGLYNSLSAAVTAARYQIEARMKLAGDQVRIEVSDEGAIYPVTIDPTLTQQQKLEPSDAGESDNFGSSVAISGDTVVIGSPLDDGAAGIDQGSAYVFVRSGGVWSQQQKLEASDASVRDFFGNSVAISGDTVVVGAPLDDAVGDEGQGSAYVFVRNGGVWSQQQKLEASDAGIADLFGQAVAISEETVVVGAPFDDGAGGFGFDQGSAYVFVRSGGIWSQQQKLEASDAGERDNFAFQSVAINGDTVVIGADFDDGAAGAEQGSAYVFVRSGGVWSQQQKLEASDASANDRFGLAVAISGDTIVVGAFGDTGAAGAEQGSAYVFVRSGAVWSQQQKLEASDAGAGDFLGLSAAISGDTVVVGAVFDDGAAGADQGSAYVFARSGGVWSQQQKLEASDAGAGAFFANSVAISGDTVVVGAVFDDGAAGPDQGSAYVFSPPLTNQPPNCGGAFTSVVTIWPPNHDMVSVTIQGVTDPDGDPVTINIDQIKQDEPTDGTGDGHTCPDGAGIGTSTAQVRAERSAKGNGRVYTIYFTASDGAGGSCQGSVTVCAPNSRNGSCTNGGANFDSTQCDTSLNRQSRDSVTTHRKTFVARPFSVVHSAIRQPNDRRFESPKDNGKITCRRSLSKTWSRLFISPAAPLDYGEASRGC
jgi:predicted amidohydrolase